jgi:hypothetical protein
MNVNVHFTDASKRQMNSSFSNLKRATYSGAWNMINRLAMFTAGSASRAARISVRKREMVTAKNSMELRQLGGKYAVKCYRELRVSRKTDETTRNITWATTNDKDRAELLRVIRFRGLAKASWGSIMQKMGLAGGKMSASIRGLAANVWPVARGVTWVKFQKTSPMSIEFVNRLRYMEKIQPSILSDAITTAQARMMGSEKATMEKAQRAAWNKAA